MPNDEAPGAKERTEEQKDVVFYEKIVGAWVDTRMTRDKTIVQLSAGGIALLVTLITTVAPKSSCEKLFYGLAFLCFLAAICAALTIFQKNADYLGDVVRRKLDEKSTNGKADEKLTKCLKRLDKLTFLSFVLALLFSIMATFAGTLGGFWSFLLTLLFLIAIGMVSISGMRKE